MKLTSMQQGRGWRSAASQFSASLATRATSIGEPKPHPSTNFRRHFRPVPYFHQLPGPNVMASSSSTSMHALSATQTAAAMIGSSLLPSRHALHVFFAFCLGGLFFTSAAAVASAVYAIGMRNVRELLALGRGVIAHVWGVFCLGLGASKAALRGDDKGWKWRNAWQVLREQLGETRKAAAEGVQAIKLERNMYAATVGQPGLLVLQYMLDNLTPKLVAATMEQALRESLADVKNPNIRRLTLSSFELGDKPPKLLAAKAYNLGPDAMAFDVDAKWDSEAKLKINLVPKALGFRIPVKVKNLSFQGPVRIEMTPLIAEPPGFGAALVSLPQQPRIGFDMRLAGGEITRMPWLRSEIMKTIQQAIQDEALWPKRMIIPSEKSEVGFATTILSKRELDELNRSDPLLTRERMYESQSQLGGRLKSNMRQRLSQQQSGWQVDVHDESNGEAAHNAAQFDHDAVQNGIIWALIQDLIMENRHNGDGHDIDIVPHGWHNGVHQATVHPDVAPLQPPPEDSDMSDSLDGFSGVNGDRPAINGEKVKVPKLASLTM